MIDLPSNPQPNGAEPYFVDFGGWQTSALGGPATRIDRLGDRFGLSVSLPAMRIHDEARGIHAREWISKLLRAVSEGARIAFPQPDFVPAVGASATATLSAAAASGDQVLSLQGLSAGAVLQEGMFFSVIDASGRHYLHSIAQADAPADGTGAITVTVHPRIRTAFAAGSTVLLGAPKIEGRLVGDRHAWTLELARTVGLSFEIMETR